MGLDAMPEVMTVQELMDFLKISRSTIHRAIRDGKLEAFKAGRDLRFEKQAVMKWVKK